ncbi:uncharacterized protein MAM_01323 [Metarhizium album ARSEF 1941]|uniref:Endosomal SPRY domain protein n=1 Tax=Metarhizium album (strain ARSEF 1941) TaxID=1081103 RepID=A0A0B2X514_METAS|nr:uncharacterized protein MAM_01323 [Metarhizium album ARSEF 1941]KHO00545.1 hypothetical protein MAM_01323 [Metarhizium album ARSEF 1941]
MAPVLSLVKHSLRSFMTATTDAQATRHDGDLGPLDGPLGEASRIFAREDKQTPDPSHGVLDPHDINNVGFFVLFAMIGVGFVVTGIWFFFWAKNGGIHFKENDWEEYKSTVLRRKGPNGTVLSGATKTTKLGGGSVYKDVADDDGTTVVTESTGLSGVTAGASDIAAREKRRAKQEARERERRKRRGSKRGSKRHVGEGGVTDEMAEKAALEELRSYRHEKSARVGGLNKESDGSQWDGSTNPSGSAVSSEPVSSSDGQSRPTQKPAPIRKVYSTADRNAARESERIRSEARRLREESRVSRRDFSYNRPGAAESNASESLLEGSDLGTKTHHHPTPEPRALREQQREERRTRRGGYRRGRTEDHDL